MKENVQISILDEVVESIEEQRNAQDSERVCGEQVDAVDGIYIFMSFDLVNSTLFKGRHRDMWPGFISAFYECVLKGFGIGQYKLQEVPSDGYEVEVQKTGGFHLWKLVGDEVLLYHKVVSKEELYDTIIFVEMIRKNLIKETIRKCLGEEPSDDECKKLYNERAKLYEQYFSVKTTVWLGNCVENVQLVDADKQNIVFDQMVLDNEASILSRKLDFLGPDIDEGFRVCGYAEKGKMIVTPKLVYLLMKAFEGDLDKQTVLVSNFRIASYVSMKGIWEQRLYPIIMFCQNDTRNTTPLENWKKQFEYDAFETSKLYENIDKYGEKFLTDPRFSIKNLEKIYRDILREDEMERMLESLNRQEKQLESFKGVGRRATGNFEFHIACLCYNKDEQKYWLINHLTHGWSFGCIRIQKNERYLEYVQEAYERKYDLKIHLEENAPLLSFYTTNREPIGKGTILGVVLLTTVVSGDCKKPGIESGWYTYEQIKDGTTLRGKKLNGFDEIIERAHDLINK